MLGHEPICVVKGCNSEGEDIYNLKIGNMRLQVWMCPKHGKQSKGVRFVSLLDKEKGIG